MKTGERESGGIYTPLAPSSPRFQLTEIKETGDLQVADCLFLFLSLDFVRKILVCQIAELLDQLDFLGVVGAVIGAVKIVEPFGKIHVGVASVLVAKPPFFFIVCFKGLTIKP